MNANRKYISFLSCLISLAGVIACIPALGASDPDGSGWDQFQSNDITAAKSTFQSEIAKNPSDVSAHHGLALIEWMENDPAASSDMLAVVKLAPNDPRAWSDWQTMLTNTTYFGIRPRDTDAWKALSGDSSAPPALRSSALEAVAESDRLHGNVAGATAIWDKLDYIHAWKVIGPFDNVSKSGFKKAFEPETEGIRLDAQVTGKDDIPVAWRTLPLVLEDGTCELGSFLGDQASSVFYSTTAVDSPADKQVVLWFSPIGASKVWIDEQLVLNDDIYRNHNWLLGDTFAIPVHLKAGPNTILVKSADDDTTNSGFQLRFTDPGGETPIALAADPSKSTGIPQAAAPGVIDAQPVLVELAKKAPVNRQNLEALAVLQEDFYDYDAARETIQQAIKLAPSDAWLE